MSARVIDLTAARAERGLLTRAARTRIRRVTAQRVPQKSWLCPRCKVTQVTTRDVLDRLSAYPDALIASPGFGAAVMLCRGDCAIDALLEVEAPVTRA